VPACVSASVTSLVRNYAVTVIVAEWGCAAAAAAVAIHHHSRQEENGAAQLSACPVGHQQWGPFTMHEVKPGMQERTLMGKAAPEFCVRSSERWERGRAE